MLNHFDCYGKCLMAAVMLLLFGLAACERTLPEDQKADLPASLVLSETADTVAYRLPDGEISVLPKHPRRTIILLTSLLNLWVESGGAVIARCTGDINVPAEALDAPEVGSFNNPNVEKIIALQPDFVISSDVANFHAIIPILEKNRIPYAFFRYINHHDYVHIRELFSKINGTEEKFRTDYDQMNQEVNGIVQKCRAYPSPKVLVIFTSSNSVSCELPGSQVGEMLSMLGARNIIPAEGHPKNATRVNFSLERIVELDPDIILLNTMGEVATCRKRLKKEFESNAAWSSLRAIRNERFYVLPKKYFLYKPNNEFPTALHYLAGILYPAYNTGRPEAARLPNSIISGHKASGFGINPKGMVY